MLVLIIWLIGTIITGIVIYPKKEDETTLTLLIWFTSSLVWPVYWILRIVFLILILKEDFSS